MAARNGDDALVEIGKVLREVADEMRPAVEDLRRAEKRTKRVLRLAVIGIGLDMILSVALTVNAVRTERALDTAARSELVAVVTCEGTNEIRRAELDLWLPLLLEPPDPTAPPPTAEEEKARAEFEASLRKNFALKDCR